MARRQNMALHAFAGIEWAGGSFAASDEFQFMTRAVLEAVGCNDKSVKGEEGREDLAHLGLVNRKRRALGAIVSVEEAEQETAGLECSSDGPDVFLSPGGIDRTQARVLDDAIKRCGPAFRQIKHIRFFSIHFQAEFFSPGPETCNRLGGEVDGGHFVPAAGGFEGLVTRSTSNHTDMGSGREVALL